MPHQVFISYSTHDKATAETVCAAVEGRDLRCWIAPRDIAPGANWAADIPSAIKSARAFILILSSKSNESPQVFREVSLAFDNDVPVVPFRIEEIRPAGPLEYYLNTQHWFDAFTPTIEMHASRLAETVHVLLSKRQAEPHSVAADALGSERSQASDLKADSDADEESLPIKGRDLRYDLEISLEQAYAGTEVAVDIPAAMVCEACAGSGCMPGASPTTCGPCHGVGQVRRRRTLAVRIPAGVGDGQRLRLAGEGDAGTGGGPRGDLYIFISLKPHELFERDGLDLLCSAPVPMRIAALGGEIEVATLSPDRPKITIKVPAGTQTGRTLRLKGMGMPALEGDKRGDLIVEAFVETPTPEEWLRST